MFSLDNWLGDRGLDKNSSVSDVVANDLLVDLGLSDYMDFSDKCELAVSPYLNTKVELYNGNY